MKRFGLFSDHEAHEEHEGGGEALGRIENGSGAGWERGIKHERWDVSKTEQGELRQ